MNPKKNWTIDEIGNLEGKVAIVTGSSSGIGYEAARVMANKGAEVVIAVRNLSKGEKAEEKIKAQNPQARTKLMLLDLADLQSVKNFALPTLRAALDDQAESGDFFGPRGFQEMRGFPVKVRPKALAQKKDVADRLWKVSQELTGVYY